MSLRLVDRSWQNEFTVALLNEICDLRIICPFIKEDALQRLLSHHPKRVQVITRFRLGDYADKVSDVAALRMLLDAGASVRGVRNLHAKLYLFDKKRAIITSCNLTEAALSRNQELGVVTTDGSIIKTCLDYFDRMWSVAGDDLVHDKVDAWDKKITNYWLGGGRPLGRDALGDSGVNLGLEDEPIAQAPKGVPSESQAFVKFLGLSDERSLLSDLTIEIIRQEGCNWSVCFRRNRRPRSVRDGDIVFMGRLTRKPDDIRVFGRAIGMAYKKGRDDATEAEKDQRTWRVEYPHYSRVYQAEFIDGCLANGVSLYALMEQLGADSFASTQRNKEGGEGNTNPRLSIRQHGYVKLSAEGLSWLSERFEKAIDTHGKVSQEILNTLDWPDPSILSPPQS